MQFVDDFDIRVFGDDFLIFGLGILLFEVLPFGFGVSFEAPSDEFLGGGAHVIPKAMFIEISKGRFLSEGLPVICLAGREGIADIFHSPFIRHGFNQNASLIKIGPIFPMVRISSHMMLANFGEIAIVGPFVIYWGVGSGIVMGGTPELFGRVFAQIVMEGEEKDSDMRGVPKDLMTMLRYGDEVSHHFTFLAIVFHL